MSPVMIRSLNLKNILSFGPDSTVIELGPLNLIIGPNGSGKSNLLEIIGLLSHARGDVKKPIREGGGSSCWLWMGGDEAARVEAIVSNPRGSQNLRYTFSFGQFKERFDLRDEVLENEKPYEGQADPNFYYQFNAGHPVMNVNSKKRSLKREDVDFDLSILAQRKDPEIYPEITYLGEAFGQIKIYKNWQFGQFAAPRHPCSVDLPNDALATDLSNLPLVLNWLRTKPAVKERIQTYLRELFDGIKDFDVSLVGRSAQVFLQEGAINIPAVRLSDGTLRFLCLLAILCDPNPAPLICIEEPELGLHPDVVPVVAELLVEASTRTQIIVTTHSFMMVDAMTDQPESVLVCEKHDAQTQMNRLNPDKLKVWLEKYRLGDLWSRGQLGGNRW